MENTLQMLMDCAAALTKKFPEGNDPFRICSRLLEEAGEVAKEVAHIEHTGIKDEKYGAPDIQKLANELVDLMGVSMQLLQYYQLEESWKHALESRVQRLKDTGWID